MGSVLTVSQLNKYVGFKLSQDIKLKGVAVKGEISNFTCHYKTGHLYFTLNDACAQVKAVMFASAASKLRFEPDDGLSVLAVGNVELYEKGGQYQIIVNELATCLLKYPEQMTGKLEDVKKAADDMAAGLDKGYDEAKEIVESINKKGN